MKIKIELEEHEHQDDADDLLEKALHNKKECSDHERYADPILNDFHDYVTQLHTQLLERISSDIEAQLKGI